MFAVRPERHIDALLHGRRGRSCATGMDRVVVPFHHVCNRAVAGARRDTAEVFLIEVHDNVVTERLLVPGLPEEWRSVSTRDRQVLEASEGASERTTADDRTTPDDIVSAPCIYGADQRAALR